MAGTTLKRVTRGAKSSAVRDLTIQLNKLIADVEELRRGVSYMMPGVVLTDPGNKTGTSDATTWRTEAYTFTFRGLIVSSAAQEKALTGTTHDVAASKEAWFVLSVATDGTSYTITKAADQTIGTVLLPTGPDNQIIVGYLQIVTGASGFTAGTDDLVADGPKIASLAFTDAPSLGAAAFLAAKIADSDGTVIDE